MNVTVAGKSTKNDDTIHQGGNAMNEVDDRNSNDGDYHDDSSLFLFATWKRWAKEECKIDVIVVEREGPVEGEFQITQNQVIRFHYKLILFISWRAICHAEMDTIIKWMFNQMRTGRGATFTKPYGKVI